jgi:nitrile hydratase subunit beta
VNGVHDLGGMHGFGPVVREENEPVFHADWERRTFRLMRALLARRAFNPDEFRHSIERMAPAEYLETSYYEHWLRGIERLLLEKGVVTREEFEAALRRMRDHESSADGAAQPVVKAGSADARGSLPANTAVAQASGLRHDPGYKARFVRGDHVVARNMNPVGHTRLPRHARGRRGVIREDLGVFVFPDTHAHGRGANPQHCYSVEFTARELWGADHSETDHVYLDLWEDYLGPDLVSAAVDNGRNASAKGRKPQRQRRQAVTPKAKPAAAKPRQPARGKAKQRAARTTKAARPKRKSR